MLSKLIINTVMSLVLSGLVVSPVATAEETRQRIFQIVSENERFDTFINLVENTGMDSELRNLSEATLFVPVNEIFDNLSEERRSFLFGLGNVAELRKLVRQHILYESVDIYEVAKKTEGTLPGRIKVTVDDGEYYVNGARVVTPAYNASNGVVYGIEGVFFPEFLEWKESDK